MKTPPMTPRARRDIFGLLALCLLIGGVLFFIVRWRESPLLSRRTARDARQTRLDACREPVLALSPSGKYLAAVCRVQIPPAQRTTASYSTELVVWSMTNGLELSRVPIEKDNDYRVLWSGNEQFIGIEARFTQIFHWSAKKRVNNAILRATAPDPGMTDMDIEASWLDMDGDVKVQSLDEGGLQAFRLSSGKPIPVKWRWKQEDEWKRRDWEMTLIPSKPGGPLHALVMQEEEQPRPRPTPVPTPVPTPALTPEQRAFLEKEKALDEEVGQIVEKLQGDEPPSEEEAARLEARGKSIVKSLREEKQRLFPISKFPTSPPVPPRFAHVMRVDLKSGRVLWKKRIRTGTSLPRMLCSPDGALFAIIGIKSNNEPPAHAAQQSSWGRGIDFWSVETGSTVGSAAMTEAIERHQPYNMHWLPSRVLFVRNGNAYDKNEKMLFLHAHGARLLETRPVPKLKSSDGETQYINDISVSADGRTWVFSSYSDGWFGYTFEDFRDGKEAYVRYR